MLEPNNIYCGDSYELIKDIPDKSIDLIVTDPPYEIKGLHQDTGLLKGRKNSHNSQLRDNNLGDGINLNILDEYVRVMKKINIYLWCNKEQIYDYLTYFVKERSCNFEIFIWAKDNPAPFLNGHFLKDKEYCLYFWEKGVKVNPSYEQGKTVYVSKVNKADKQDYEHPTIKDIEIIKNMILVSSSGGGLVLDTFLGSGTTAVACKELGRQYIGFEINKQYYDIAVDRLNGITQKERKLKNDGFIDIFDLLGDDTDD